MPEIVIRPAQPEDQSAVYGVLYESWNTSYAPLLGRNAALKMMPTSSLLKIFMQVADRQDEVQFDVAEIDGRVAGFVCSQPDFYLNRHFLGMLYVRPTHQHRGIGQRLLASTIACAGKTRALRLHILRDNTKAQIFYERHGFNVIRNGWDWAAWQPIKVLQRNLRAEDRVPVEPKRTSFSDQALRSARAPSPWALPAK